MLCPNVNVYIFGCVFKNYLHRLTAIFSYFFSNEVGADAENPGCAKDFWSAGANHLLDLTFFFPLLVFPLAVQQWN